MEYLKDIIDMYNYEIILAMGLMIFLLLIFSIVNRITTARTLKRYRDINKILSTGNSDNIKDTLTNYVQEVKFIKNSLNSVSMKCEDISHQITGSMQKVGFVRYNAFDDIGSDLSFSIALLDGKSDGFVMSNIYARDESNVYAKPIKSGQSTYQLSVEEKEAVENAMSGREKLSV